MRVPRIRLGEVVVPVLARCIGYLPALVRWSAVKSLKKNVAFETLHFDIRLAGALR